MPISVKQLKVAQWLARGASKTDAARAASVSETIVYRWLKDDEFVSMVNLLSSREIERNAELADSIGSGGDISKSRNDELEIREYLRPLALNICNLSKGLVERILSEEQENPTLGPSAIPKLLSAMETAISMLRIGADRITGLETLLDEISKIDSTIAVHKSKSQRGAA